MRDALPPNATAWAAHMRWNKVLITGERSAWWMVVGGGIHGHEGPTGDWAVLHPPLGGSYNLPVGHLQCV